jgi:hypothetical protein
VIRELVAAGYEASRLHNLEYGIGAWTGETV